MNRINAMSVRKGISLFAFLAILASCKENQKQTNSTAVSDSIEQSSEKTGIGITFTDAEKKRIFHRYLKIRDALVNSNAKETKLAAQELANEVSDITIKNPVEEIASTDDIVLQRKGFERLSNEIEILLMGSLASGEIYKQYCPMAFGDTGAVWLSDSKEILNPYLGEKMPHCGTVKGTIK